MKKLTILFADRMPMHVYERIHKHHILRQGIPASVS